MTLHLVRHAIAGIRGTWTDGGDFERPLTDEGQAQAQSLVDWFAPRPVERIWSSQALRCRQTVAPLAEARSLSVDVRDELTEGGRAGTLLELVRETVQSEGDSVLCSHGDLIPEVLNYLLREGMTITGGRGCERGSIWSLEARGRDIVSGTYTAQP